MQENLYHKTMSRRNTISNNNYKINEINEINEYKNYQKKKLEPINNINTNKYKTEINEKEFDYQTNK